MQDTRISIAETVPLDKASPFRCLKSMGLLNPYYTKQNSFKIITEVSDAKAMSIVWTTFGGVDITLLDRSIVIKNSGQRYDVVEGPRAIPECKSNACSLFVCKIRIVKLGIPDLEAMSMISIDHVNHIADVCVYDPKWLYSTRLCYAAENIKTWMRGALGQGWGVRVEVLTEMEVPSDIINSFHGHEHRNMLSKFWIFLICLLKSYFPHMTGSEIVASLTRDSESRSVGLINILLDAIHNIGELIQGNVPGPRISGV